MPTLFTSISPLKPDKDITLARGCLQLGGVSALCVVVLILIGWWLCS